MSHEELEATARAMVAPGKGLLAIDESMGTIKKRFDAIGIESTEENRRAYRELLITTAGAHEFVSGMILFDETIRQSTKAGVRFADALKAQGILPGIKVDAGAKNLAGHPDEKVTEGLDGLRERLAEYVKLGARFAKWRAVITIGDGIPSAGCIRANAHALARYAALCQEAKVVPIVEPEVLMDGDHEIDRCDEVTEFVLKTVFQELYYARVKLEGMVLKPNMVVPGKKSAKQVSDAEIAERSLRVLKACVPAAVPGIAFLSGGQSDVEATARLNAMNRIGDLPWRLSFSYGRALQAAPQKAWSGKSENKAAAQSAFAHRAEMNGLATLGKWSAELEKKAA
jgi:fructose-bisphosphate aldolase class I